MSDTFDKTSTLRIDGEVLNRSSFGINAHKKLYRRIGNDATDPLYVNITNATSAVLLAEYSEISSLVSGALTNILTYTVAPGTTLSLACVEVSGENIAEYSVEIDGTVKGTKRTYFSGGLNTEFNFNNFSVAEGKIIRVRVIHSRPTVGNFNATLLGSTI